MKVLAIIDMQKDFIDGVLGTKEAVSIVPRVAARLKKAREDGETVVFTRDTHHAEYLSTQEGRNLPVPHCIEETEGWQIDAALPVLDAPVFDKPGFGSPALIEYLKRLPELERVESCRCGAALRTHASKDRQKTPRGSFPDLPGPTFPRLRVTF